MNRYLFEVPGLPQTQGSMRGFVVKGRAVLTSTNKGLKAWRKAVADAALASGWASAEPMDGPVRLDVTFMFVRPKGHYRTNHEIKPSAPPFPHTSGGDLDKLVRAIGDALTKIAWTDDRRIVICHAAKEWSNRNGVIIHIRPLYEVPA